MAADPKPAARIVNRNAMPLDDSPLRFSLCPLCGSRRRPLSRHHVIPKGQGGDDVPENLLWVCGHGTVGCHGVLTHHNRDGASGLDYPTVAARLVGHLYSLRGGQYLAYVARKKYDGWLLDYYQKEAA